MKDVFGFSDNDNKDKYVVLLLRLLEGLDYRSFTVLRPCRPFSDFTVLFGSTSERRGVNGWR